jgi:hypothetical protein
MIYKICEACGERMANHRHHKFPQHKAHIEKYSRKVINSDFNIAYVCAVCHSSHACMPKRLMWSEEKFLEEMKHS